MVVVATIPLEITKLFLPAFGSSNLVDGRVASSLDIARIALLGLLSVVVLSRRGSAVISPSSALGGFIAAFTAVACLSVFWSESTRATVVEAFRLGFLVMGYAAIVSTLDRESSIRRVRSVLEWVLIAMAVATIAQRLTGVFLWNFPLAPTGRSNVTYADPNTLGGHLAFAVVLVAVNREPRHSGHSVTSYLVLVGVLLGGIFATGSRSSLVAAMLGLGYVTLRGSRLGMRWPRRTLLLAAGLAGTVFILNSEIRQRFATLLGGNNLGPRPFLLRAGWSMYLDHPLVGVGLGAFPDVYRSDYREFFSYYGEAGVASHTSSVTILAELGLVGLALMVAIIVSAYTRPAGMTMNRTLTRDRLGLEGALLVLIVTSQSEGRLLQDPLFWVVIAMIAATDRVFRRTKQGLPQLVGPISAHPAS